MGIRRRLVAAAAGVALVVSAGLAAAGSASASQGPIIFTSTTANGGNSVAGWSAFQGGTFTLTHIEAYEGSSGHSEWENLPVDTALATAHVGQVLSPSAQPTGGLGIALCDRNAGSLGEAAQLGIVNVGGGLFDEVEGIGIFGSTALNSSGDVCDNGIIGAAVGSHAAIIKVLLTGIHANDTVQAGIAYNAKQNYTFGGHVVAKGFITFYATDLVNPVNTNEDFLGGATFLSQPLVTNEADVGVVSLTTGSVPLSGGSLIPAANGGSLESVAPNEFARFAHVKLSANSTIIGHHMVSGAGAFEATNVPWNVYPVASTSDGTPGGILKMEPQQFAADNFAVEGGLVLV